MTRELESIKRAAHHQSTATANFSHALFLAALGRCRRAYHGRPPRAAVIFGAACQDLVAGRSPAGRCRPARRRRQVERPQPCQGSGGHRRWTSCGTTASHRRRHARAATASHRRRHARAFSGEGADPICTGSESRARPVAVRHSCQPFQLWQWCPQHERHPCRVVVPYRPVVVCCLQPQCTCRGAGCL